MGNQGLEAWLQLSLQGKLLNDSSLMFTCVWFLYKVVKILVRKGRNRIKHYIEKELCIITELGFSNYSSDIFTSYLNCVCTSIL